MATHPTQYAHPEALVETDWLEKHLKDEGIRIVESNEDVLLYDTGHIPGAVHIDWRADLQDPVIRDYISPEKFAELCSRNGITPDTTCIFYGDKANWWACYALSTFRNTRRQIIWRRRSGSITRSAHSSMKRSRKVRAANRWSMCARRANIEVRSRICQSIRRKACCAAATFRARRACHGKRPRMTTAHSSQRQNWRKFISINAESVLKRTLLSIAESASVPVTPGS